MTDNPMMIMVVNMTIVFVVLFLLGLVIELIHKLDPTKTTKEEFFSAYSEIFSKKLLHFEFSYDIILSVL